MKRALGFKYTTGAVILAQIDSLAEQRRKYPQVLQKNLQRSGAKSNYMSQILTIWQNQISSAIFFTPMWFGIQSYIPKLPTYQQSTFIPYIYSKKEIDAIFKACDELRLQIVQTDSGLFCMPSLIRLLYSTGLRISEALAMKMEDVNLDENYLLVRIAKVEGTYNTNIRLPGLCL